MKNLLKFELHNSLRQVILYIPVLVMLVLLTLNNQASPDRLAWYQSIGYGIEDMVVGALTTCFFTSFMAVIVSFVVCRDYEQNVIKNVYAKGYSHGLVYGAKFLYVMLLTTVVYVVTILLAYGEAVHLFGHQKTDIFMIMVAQYVAALAYSAFDYMVCQILRKTGFAMAILILIPPLGGMLLDQIDGMLPISFCFGDLWITQTMSYIHGGTITGKEITLSLITSAAYMVGCYLIGHKVSKSRG